MNVSIAYVLDRLKEPSTWAAIAVFVGMFGISSDTLDRITANAPAIITALATLVAIFAPSTAKTTVVVPNGTVTADGATASVSVSGPVKVEAPAETPAVHTPPYE